MKDLDGNVDVRDYLQNVLTNSVNGTTTQNAFSVGDVRLDQVIVDLARHLPDRNAPNDHICG